MRKRPNRRPRGGMDPRSFQQLHKPCNDGSFYDCSMSWSNDQEEDEISGCEDKKKLWFECSFWWEFHFHLYFIWWVFLLMSSLAKMMFNSMFEKFRQDEVVLWVFLLMRVAFENMTIPFWWVPFDECSFWWVFLFMSVPFDECSFWWVAFLFLIWVFCLMSSIFLF